MPKVIETEQDYTDALKRVEEIFDAKPDTPEGNELELLSMNIERYEAEAFPIDHLNLRMIKSHESS